MCDWKQKERQAEMVNEREREKQVGNRTYSLYVCQPRLFIKTPLLTVLPNPQRFRSR